MFVHNQIDGVLNYHDAVARQFRQARKADLVIAYVQQSGVSLLKKYITSTSCEVRLVCSFDMEITDPLAVKQLMDMGVTVKIYQAPRGTLHTKLWLFEDANGKHDCLIGSANLSAAALRDNVEAGVLITSARDQKSVDDARNAFDLVWRSKNCQTVTDETIRIWVQARNQKEEMKKRLMNLKKRPASISENASAENVSILETYVKGWIDIGVGAKTEGGSITGRLWRGWYIIPDQGYIDDNRMEHLRKVCSIISSAPDQTISLSPGEDRLFEKILDLTARKFIRPNLSMTPRGLFIRQEKNYLLHFGFAEHPEKPNGKPDKSSLTLTTAGSNFAVAESIAALKRIYTRNMRNYSYNNLHLLPFLYELLEHTRTLNFVEFSFFVSHAYSVDQIGNVAELINIYRGLSPQTCQQFENDMKTYFRRRLEPTANNVRGNYNKKVKYAMSALGWCQKLQYDAENQELRLVRRQRVRRDRSYD